MEPVLVNFNCYRGQDFIVDFGLRDEETKVMTDFTGADVIFSARAPGSTTPMAGFNLSISANTMTYNAGTRFVTGKVEEADTAAVPDKITYLEYAIVIKWANGTSERMAEGKVFMKTKWAV